MILLTGGTGFLGGYLLRQLAQGPEKVRAIARNHSLLSPEQKALAEWVEADLSDVPALEAAMEGVKAVINTAAVVSFWKKRANEMYTTNVKGTENLVNVCLDKDLYKFVQISSVAAIGRSLAHPVVNEETPWVDGPYNSQYGITKRLSDWQVIRGKEEGLPAVIVNPGVILGEALNRNWKVGPPALFTRVANGLRFYPAGGTGFVSADDVARAVVTLLHSDFKNAERFILVSDNLTFKTAFQWMAEGLGVPAPSRQVPPFLARVAGELSERLANITGKEPIITRETTRNSARSWSFDGSKITKETPFAYTSLHDSVVKIGKSYREQGF